MKIVLTALVIVGVLLYNLHGTDANELEVTHKVIFEVEMGGSPAGTIEIGLFGNVVPKTVDNFKSFADGFLKNGKTHSYSESIFHRVIDDFMIQGGDITNHDGTGGFSIYGDRFADENFKLSHYGAGWLSMANAGPNSNGSQFFITLKQTSWLDNRHVVFGKVIKGMDLVKKIGKTTTLGNDRPKEEVRIKKSYSEVVSPPLKVSKSDATE